MLRAEVGEPVVNECVHFRDLEGPLHHQRSEEHRTDQSTCGTNRVKPCRQLAVLDGVIKNHTHVGHGGSHERVTGFTRFVVPLRLRQQRAKHFVELAVSERVAGFMRPLCNIGANVAGELNRLVRFNLREDLQQQVATGWPVFVERRSAHTGR